MTEADIPTQDELNMQRAMHDCTALLAAAERDIEEAAGGRRVDRLLWEKLYAARFAVQSAIIGRHVAETEAEAARREVAR